MIGFNLSDKFQTIIDKLDQVLANTTATNTKLDVLIAKTDDVTPIVDAISNQTASLTNTLNSQTTSVVSAINALRGGSNTTLEDLLNKPTTVTGDITVRGDVRSDNRGVEQRLDALRLSLVGPLADSTDVRQAIYNIAGPAPGVDLTQIRQAIFNLAGPAPGVDLTQIRQAIFNLAGPAPGASLLQIFNVLTALNNAVGGVPNESLQIATVRGLLSALQSNSDNTVVTAIDELTAIATAINSAVGGVPNESLEIATVRGLLSAIQLCSCNDEFAGPPATGADSCSNPYVSTGLHLVPYGLTGSGESIILAEFPEPTPAGITFGAVFGLVTVRGELVSNDWSQWKVWVASTAPQFAMEGGVRRYETNRWIPMSGSGSRAFSVSADHRLVVTLCSTAGGGVEPGGGGGGNNSGDGYRITSQPVIYSTANGGQQSIVWPLGTPKTASGNRTADAAVWLPPGSYQGWVITVVEAEYAVRVNGQLLTVGQSQIVNATDDLWVYRGFATPTFTITFNPPD